MKRVLFGGRYSSGTTPPAPGFEDFRPVPRVDLIGLDVASGPISTGRFFDNSTASIACLRSDLYQYIISHRSLDPHLSLPNVSVYAARILRLTLVVVPWHHSVSEQNQVSWACQLNRIPESLQRLWLRTRHLEIQRMLVLLLSSSSSQQRR